MAAAHGQVHGRMPRGRHGLPKVSPRPVMPDPSAPSRRAGGLHSFSTPLDTPRRMQARTARGIHGLPKVSLVSAMPNACAPCGRATPKRWVACGRLLPRWIPLSWSYAYGQAARRRPGDSRATPPSMNTYLCTKEGDRMIERPNMSQNWAGEATVRQTM
jgi:hypothetical protein